MYDFVDNLRHFLAFSAAVLLASVLFCLPAAAQSQEQTQGQDPSLLTDLDLGKTPYGWLNVLSGSPVARPQKAPYGWLCLAEGRIACAFSDDGKILWEKYLPSAAAGPFCCDEDGFAFVILKNKKLCLLNPAGLVLWQSPLGFAANFPPLPAPDGRVYVFGKNEAACLGMNGIQKWRQKTEPLSEELLPLLLDDGSLVLFLEEEDSPKSAAIRVSPFGELLERIVFSGKVAGSAAAENGGLLAFSDGRLCLLQAGQNGAEEKWIQDSLKIGARPFFLSLGNGKTAVISDAGAAGATVAAFDEKNGAADLSWAAPDIKSFEAAFLSPDGIFLAGKDFGALYSTSGKRIRGAIFPPKTKSFNWDYVFYAQNGNVLFASKNWSLAGWRLVKASQDQKGAASNAPLKRKNCRAFFKGIGKDFYRAKKAALPQRVQELKNGGYGEAEKEFVFDCEWIAGDYLARLTKAKSVGGAVGAAADGFSGGGIFDFSKTDERAAIYCLGLFGSEEAARFLARVLSESRDENALCAALRAVQECGYDPCGEILDAIEPLAKSALFSQEELPKEICRAVFSLVRFMGSHEYSKKGMKILRTLQLTRVSDSTKEEARKVYEKLVELKM